jgi:alpha-glucosidase (family GH31 glycosyl hydrolase)
MLGYLNPFLVDVPDAPRNLFGEARDAGFLVRNQEGEPYMIGPGGFARNAKLFAALCGYRRALLQEVAARGTPLRRPLWPDAPDNPLAWSVEGQLLLGPDLRVAPVLVSRQRMREVCLPRGTCRRVWSGRRFEVAEGHRVRVACPLGEPPAFVRAESALESEWAQALSAQGLEHGLPAAARE